MAKIELSGRYQFTREQVWSALTTREALSEWLMHTDFELKIGHKFCFHDKPQGGWRGFMECSVLEYKDNEYLKIDWLGEPEHDLQYVEFFLSDVSGGETELRIVHTVWNSSHGAMGGFILRKIITFGWKKMLNKQLGRVLEEGAKVGFENVAVNLVNPWRQGSV